MNIGFNVFDNKKLERIHLRKFRTIRAEYLELLENYQYSTFGNLLEHTEIRGIVVSDQIILY